jgi:hypothetical protein
MPRRIKLPSLEQGDIHLLWVSNWEGGWDILRGTVFGDLISVVSKEVIDHALHGLSRPLVDALGIPPEGALRKDPRQCWHRDKHPPERLYRCPLYHRTHCQPISKHMPWCFEPEGEFSKAQRSLASKAIEVWREGAYVVVVV